jgi:hypothetical protein
MKLIDVKIKIFEVGDEVRLPQGDGKVLYDNIVEKPEKMCFDDFHHEIMVELFKEYNNEKIINIEPKFAVLINEKQYIEQIKE